VFAVSLATKLVDVTLDSAVRMNAWFNWVDYFRSVQFVRCELGFIVGNLPVNVDCTNNHSVGRFTAAGCLSDGNDICDDLKLIKCEINRKLL